MASIAELLRLKRRYAGGGTDTTVYEFDSDAKVDPSEYEEILPRKGKKRYFYRRPMTDTRAGHTAKPYDK